MQEIKRGRGREIKEANGAAGIPIGFSQSERQYKNENERGISGCKITFSNPGACCIRPAATCELSSADLVGPLDLPSGEIQIQIPDSRSPSPMLPRHLGHDADHGSDDQVCVHGPAGARGGRGFRLP